MSTIEIIKEVATFADQAVKEELDHIGYGYVCFAEGEVWARSPAGGCVRKVDLDLEGAVPAKKLLKALASCKGEPTFDRTEHYLTLSGGGSKARVQTRPLNKLPRMHRPEKKAKWTEVAGLGEAKRVAWSVSKDASRAHLTGVYLDALGLTATNGASLAHFKLDTGLKAGFLIEPKLLRDLPDVVWLAQEDAELFIAEDKAKTGFRVASVIQQTFPPYGAILEGAPTSGFTAPTKDLVDLVKRARLSHHQGILEVTGQELHVRVEDTGLDSLFQFQGSLPVEPLVNHSMPAGRIGLDLGLLLPCLEAAEGETVDCSIEMTDRGGLAPSFFRSGRFVGVVMPWRLGG